MDTTVNNINHTTKAGFWKKLQRFFLRVGYIRAAGELYRMGRGDLAKKIESDIKNL